MTKLPRRTVLEVIPSARRLMTSLRNLGYDFVHSVADLVDNSIAARATRIDIRISFEGQNSWFRIADNGSGMTAGEITEAMRLGSERDYDDDELGKHGLGLKTASLAQCRRLTVSSKRRRRPLQIRCLDLDHVQRTNRWEVFSGDTGTRSELLRNPLDSPTGTVVVWESLDRLQKYKNPWGKPAKNNFLKMIEGLDLHLGMVFHRFLTGEASRKRPLAITVNDSPTEPWDPYARSEGATESLASCDFDVHSQGGLGNVRFRPFVLPPKATLTPTEHKRLGGSNGWNQQQGLYIYRADRMIQSGGWCGLRARDEHLKLARASLDFFPDLDSAFDVNVAKARVNLPGDLVDQLKPEIDRLVGRANAVYRNRPDDGGKSRTRKPRAAASVRQRRGTAPREALEAAAVAVKRGKALRLIADRLQKDNPVVARDLGW